MKERNEEKPNCLSMLILKTALPKGDTIEKKCLKTIKEKKKKTDDCSEQGI